MREPDHTSFREHTPPEGLLVSETSSSPWGHINSTEWSSFSKEQPKECLAILKNLRNQNAKIWYPGKQA